MVRNTDAAALEAFLDDPPEFLHGGFGVLDGNGRQAEQAPVGGAGVIVQPIVVVLLAGYQELRVLEAEEAEEAGVEELGVDAVFILILVPPGAVADAGAQPVVAFGEDALRFFVAHVVHFRLVAGAPLQRDAVALAHAGEAHAPAHAARPFGRNDDGVVYRAGAYYARRVVAEALDQASEHGLGFNDVRIGGNRPQCGHCVLPLAFRQPNFRAIRAGCLYELGGVGERTPLYKPMPAATAPHRQAILFMW